MQLFLKVFTNPLGIAINAVHWAVVFFAFYGQVIPFDKKTCLHCEQTITEWIMNFDIIPILLTQFIAYPLEKLLGKNELLNTHLLFVLIFIIISQWFLVGFIINFLIDFHKPKEIKIPLK